MERRKFIKTAGTVGIGAAIAGCTDMGGTGGNDDADTGNGGDGGDGGDDNGGFNIDGEIAEDSVDQLKFTDVDLYRLVASGGNDSGDTNDTDIFGNEGDGAGVRGELKNTADQAYKFVEVQVTLYDDTDDVLGEWLDNTEQSNRGRLNPGSTWQFNVIFEGADIGQAARYTISAEGNLQNEGGENGTQNGTDGMTTTTDSPS